MEEVFSLEKTNDRAMANTISMNSPIRIKPCGTIKFFAQPLPSSGRVHFASKKSTISSQVARKFDKAPSSKVTSKKMYKDKRPKLLDAPKQ